MKQNLIQKQLRLSNSKPNNNKNHSKSKEKAETVDFTLKAFFIAHQILDTEYLFSKKALVTFLHGKPINLQQPNNQRPPSSLKGYMSHQDDELIEKIIDLMIDLCILGEKRINLKQRSTKRLYTVKKFQLQNFPKVSINSKQEKKFKDLPLMKRDLPLIKRMQKTQNQKVQCKQKSSLSQFLVNKTSLPTNIQKRQLELKMKMQRQKEQEQQRKRKLQQQIRHQIQQEIQAIEDEKRKQLQIKLKQEEKQTHLNKMNNFWLKEKQKIQSFISPTKRKNHNSEKYKHQKAKNDEKCLEIAGNVLQMQMKQLKEQQEQKKNPIKPFITWSFVKNALEIDSSQSNNDKKQQFTPLIQVKKEKLSSKKSFKKSSQQKFVTQCSSIKKSQQKNPTEYKAPYLGIYQQTNQVQNLFSDHSLSIVDTESTDVTMTNYRLQKFNTKTKKSLKQNEYEIEKQEVFAKNSQDSMFSNSYYALRDKGQQTVTNKKIQKSKNKSNQQNVHQKDRVLNLKRRSTIFLNEQTFTIARKISQKNLFFHEKKQIENEKQVKQKFYKRQKRDQQQQTDEIHQTMTLAIPKRTAKKVSTKDFMQVFLSQDIPKYDVQMFSQTITTPEPRTKNKKISTSDLYPNSSQYRERELKRDSFVQQLIKEYYNKR